MPDPRHPSLRPPSIGIQPLPPGRRHACGHSCRLVVDQTGIAAKARLSGLPPRRPPDHWHSAPMIFATAASRCASMRASHRPRSQMSSPDKRWHRRTHLRRVTSSQTWRGVVSRPPCRIYVCGGCGDRSVVCVQFLQLWRAPPGLQVGANAAELIPVGGCCAGAHKESRQDHRASWVSARTGSRPVRASARLSQSDRNQRNACYCVICRRIVSVQTV